MMKHPPKLRSAGVFLNLAIDVLEASRRLSPFFRPVAREPELLAADTGGESLYVLAQV